MEMVLPPSKLGGQQVLSTPTQATDHGVSEDRRREASFP